MLDPRFDRADDDEVVTLAQTLADGAKLFLAFATALALLALPGEAQESPCEAVRTAAAEVMGARQAGVPIGDLLAATDAPEVHALVLDAYRRPIMADTANLTVDEYVADFALLWSFRCRQAAHLERR